MSIDNRKKSTSIGQHCPEGYSFYDGELVRDRSRLSREEQLAILDSHPFFTGVCPQCGYRFNVSKLPMVQWNCPSPDCGWIKEKKRTRIS